MKKISIIIFIVFLLDFVSTNLLFKKMGFWQYDKLLNHYWRIPSKVYHHDLLPNVNIIEPWGFKLKKRLITNSLGFRDFSNKKISKISDKKRIILIGDSAIEGAGYDYKFTLGGLLQNHLKEDYEILNSAVGSYSPSIYFKKVEYFLNEGYKFDKAIIFLDPSDIIDELFIIHDNEGKIIVENNESQKEKISDFFLNNFLIFRTILRLSDSTENLKNFLKLKYKASKKYNKSFFNTTSEDALFYRMTHVDRSAWTFDKTIFKNYEQGLIKSKQYLQKLTKLLTENKIEFDLVLYPHPSQIMYKDLYHKPFWTNWAGENNINLISMYPIFNQLNKRKIILDTFIFGDLHWNKEGTKLVFEELIKEVNF